MRIGNGPHSGPRADALGLAYANTDALVGRRATVRPSSDGARLVTAPIDVGDLTSSSTQEVDCVRILAHAESGGAMAGARLRASTLADDGSETDQGEAWTAEARVPPSKRPQWVELRAESPATFPPAGGKQLRLAFELETGFSLFAFEACG